MPNRQPQKLWAGIIFTLKEHLSIGSTEKHKR